MKILLLLLFFLSLPIAHLRLHLDLVNGEAIGEVIGYSATMIIATWAISALINRTKMIINKIPINHYHLIVVVVWLLFVSMTVSQIH
jgi:hypothetical protein